MSSIKSSVSFQPGVWKKLKKSRNRSALINSALELYFDRVESLKKADKEYWDMVENSLKGKDGSYKSVNPNGEKITDELLDNTLWS